MIKKGREVDRTLPQWSRGRTSMSPAVLTVSCILPRTEIRLLGHPRAITLLGKD